MYAEAILRVEHIDTVGVATALPSLCVETFDAIFQQAVCGISNVLTVNTFNGSLCEVFPMCEQTTPVGQCSGGGVVVWSLPCNSQSLSISLPQPPRSLLPAFMGSLRICGKGTLIARGLRSSENGEKEVIACPRSIHHRVKSPALLDTIRSVVPFPSYLAISLTYKYDLDREMP